MNNLMRVPEGRRASPNWRPCLIMGLLGLVALLAA